MKVNFTPAPHPEIARPNLQIDDYENRQYYRAKTRVSPSHLTLITTKKCSERLGFFFLCRVK
jgi:hypothetical protein